MSQQDLYERSWWDCPKCGSPTEIRVGIDCGCERHCSSCGWQQTIAETVADYKIHPYDNWMTYE